MVREAADLRRQQQQLVERVSVLEESAAAVGQQQRLQLPEPGVPRESQEVRDD